VAAIQTRIGCFLPGGGCEAGETPEQAVLREAVEESGRRLEIIRPLGQALDYFQASGSGCFYQVHSTFYLARLDDAPIHAPVDGHTLVWLDPEESAKRLFRPSQAWALGLAAGGGEAANHTPPYPILEYDSNPEAMIEPARVIRPRDVPEHCVLCFFQEVISQVVEEHQAQVAVANRWEDGPHPLYEIRYNGQRLAFCHPGIGSALAGSLLEELIGFGCRKFIACGGCGVLEKEMQVGQLVVVTAAVRDEGLSYHYLAPGRQVAAHPAGIAALSKTLEQGGIPYRLGKTWTTDAPYRETAGRTARRRQEGCITVEMEAAGLMAVAQFRKVILGQVLYGGDDLSGEQWDSRGWQSRADVRRSLFWLAAQACLAIQAEPEM
jgi:uridine phosphorylase